MTQVQPSIAQFTQWESAEVLIINIKIMAFDKPKEKAVVFFILMNNDFSLFGKVLRRITKEAGEVLTINRGLSFEKTVPVTIAFKTKNLSEEIEKLSVSLKKIKGVKGITFTEEEL